MTTKLRSYLLALDSQSGKEVWKIPRDEKSNWATPFVLEERTADESCHPRVGRLRSMIWMASCYGRSKGCRASRSRPPFEANGLLFVSSGYVMDRSGGVRDQTGGERG